MGGMRDEKPGQIPQAGSRGGQPRRTRFRGQAATKRALLYRKTSVPRHKIVGGRLRGAWDNSYNYIRTARPSDCGLFCRWPTVPRASASATIARSLARARAANNLTVTAFDAPRCFIKFRVLNGRRAGNYARDLSFHSAVRANSPQSRVHSAAERGRPSIEKFMTEIEPVRLSRFREPSRPANFRRDFTLIRVLFPPVLPEEVVSDVSRSSTTRSVIYSRVAPETIKARREGRRCAGSVGR